VGKVQKAKKQTSCKKNASKDSPARVVKNIGRQKESRKKKNKKKDISNW